MADNIRAALELSNRLAGGTRSLKGWRMSGGNSHTAIPSVVVEDDIGSQFPYRLDHSKARGNRFHTIERQDGVIGLEAVDY